jgi:hypothetical protein
MALLAIGLGAWYDWMLEDSYVKARDAKAAAATAAGAPPGNWYDWMLDEAYVKERDAKLVAPTGTPVELSFDYLTGGSATSLPGYAVVSTSPAPDNVPDGYEVVSSTPAGTSVDGRPIYNVTLAPVAKPQATDQTKKPTDCPKGTMLPCVPDWMLWGGIAMFAFTRSR